MVGLGGLEGFSIIKAISGNVFSFKYHCEYQRATNVPRAINTNVPQMQYTTIVSDVHYKVFINYERENRAWENICLSCKAAFMIFLRLIT